jgi:hypothetical protein
MSEMAPGPDLDALIAEKVMGCNAVVRQEWSWKRTGGDSDSDSGVTFWCRCIGRHNRPDENRLKPYSTDIAAAWEVVAESGVLQRWVLYEAAALGAGTVWVLQDHSERPILQAETAPLAICLGALHALKASR